MDYKDIEIRISEFVAKTQLLYFFSQNAGNNIVFVEYPPVFSGFSL